MLIIFSELRNPQLGTNRLILITILSRHLISGWTFTLCLVYIRSYNVFQIYFETPLEYECCRRVVLISEAFLWIKVLALL